MFAPRLNETDRVAYVTKQGRYDSRLPLHWRLTALLVVIKRLETHAEAARWFDTQKLPLPRNCVVPGNRPLALDHTDGELSSDLRQQAGRMPSEQIIDSWDRGYKFRALKWGVLLVCKPLFRELHNPPVIMRDDWVMWNGHVPVTRTPPRISEDLWSKLRQKAEIA
jgi:hypothetical protein